MLFSRRSFLTSGTAALGAAAASTCLASLALTHPTVGLSCLHTGRSCAIHNYNGSLSSREAKAFRSVARDWRANKVYGMDLRLVAILAGIARKAGTEDTYGLISGYRTPRTNHSLTGTASGSLHMKGVAMDIRHPRPLDRQLRDLAISLRAGGVGYYPQKHNLFVHVDTGRVRYW